MRGEGARKRRDKKSRIPVDPRSILPLHVWYVYSYVPTVRQSTKENHPAVASMDFAGMTLKLTS